MKKATASPNGQTARQELAGSKKQSCKGQPKVIKMPRHGFRYQIEYCPNPDCIQIHTRTRFPQIDNHYLDLRTTIKNAGKPGWGINGTIPPFYKELARIRGLKSAFDTDGYSLQCLKVNSLFSWDEILPKILKAIKTHVAKKRTMVELEPPCGPVPTSLRSCVVRTAF